MGRTSSYPPGAGIYKLICVNNDKLYIGKTVDFRKRMSAHRANKKDKNGYLQNAVRKYGWGSFEVEILEIFEDFDKNNEEHKVSILQKEADYIELYKSTDRTIGYNICKHSTDRTGVPTSEVTKEKLRQYNLKNPPIGMRGKKHSEATKEKLRQLNLGKKLSPESIEKTRQAHLGKPNNAYLNKNNIGKMGMSGKKHSVESIEKMRQAKLGKYRGEMTIIKPKHFKPKHFKKKEENYVHPNKGRKRSEETKAKMRISRIKRQNYKNLTTEAPTICL
jgi:group I intron endonuclease